MFHWFRVTKSARDKRGVNHDFRLKLFCLTVTTYSVEEPFCACFGKYPVAKKFFRWTFLSPSAESFVKPPLGVSLISGTRKMLGKNHKIMWRDRDSNPELTDWEPCCPEPTAVRKFRKRRGGNFGPEKKKTDPTERIIFLACFIYGGKYLPKFALRLSCGG